MKRLEKECKNKILILAPHQDDEVILCGLFLKGMIDEGYVPYVVFSTNGDYESGIGQVRLKEAIEVLSLYGIPEENIVFMGYANEYASDGPHIYDARDRQVVCSQYGNNQTFGLDAHPEYCFAREGLHRLYTRENFKGDLYGIISDIMPDIIFATDAEMHPDHKANSLMLDEVLGVMLSEHDDYRPLVLKKANYVASWWGIPDYTCINNSESKFEGRAYVNYITSQFYNPYIRWKDRIRLPIDRYAREVDREKNIVWRSLSLYKSQDAASHYERLLSSDVCFWQRRTDSLTFSSSVTASSGEASYLCDFMLYDTADISRRNVNSWELNRGIWHPDQGDNRPYISIQIQRETELESMVIYQEYGTKAQITGGKIVIDRKITIDINKLETRKPTSIDLSGIKGSRVDFIIDKYEGEVQNIGIGEVELFEKKPEKVQYIKVLLDDNFVYDYVQEDSCHNKLRIYRYTDKGNVSYSQIDSVDVTIYDQYGYMCDISKYISKAGYLKKVEDAYIKISVRDKENQTLTDEVYIYKNNKSLMQRMCELKLLEKVELSYEEIERYFASIANIRLDMLKQWHCVAKQSGKRTIPMCIKKTYARYFVQLKKKQVLSDVEEKDGYAFMIYDEYRKGISKYIKQYGKGMGKEYCQSSKEGAVYFIGTPHHKNIGDHAIAEVTLEYLYDKMPEVQVREISIENFAKRLPDLKRKITDKDIIVLQGGGNMGNIYWMNERIRWEVIKNFPDNRIIVFPETIYYDETALGQAEKKMSEQIYNKHSNIIICAREKKSFEMMRRIYPNCNVILTPDIVCYTDRWKEKADNREGALLILRNDIEKSVNDVKVVSAIVEKMGYNVSYTDMMYQRKGYIGKYNRSRIVADKISQIAGAELVVTDRLHGMILAAITGTPCVVFYGYNHKIESYYNTWFSDVSYIELIRDAKELEDAVAKVMKKAPDVDMVRKSLRCMFDVLKMK